MKRTALYLRVSSDKQAKDGESLDAQLHALRKYISDHPDIINAGEYIDDGVSGTKYSERDELQKLLSRVKNNEIDLIVFTRMDRWFRSVRHYTATQEILDAHNVGWLAIWEPIYDTTTPQGRLIVNQMMSIAQFEAENTSQRIKQVQAYKLSQHEVISGQCPAGFKIMDKHLVHNEDAPYVKRAFEYYAYSGNLADTMRMFGGTHGMSTAQAGFKNMLRSPLYKGVHYSGIEDFCPAIVSEELWEDVHRKLQMNVKRSQHHTYIFSGLLCCAECGRKMGGNTRRRVRGNCTTVAHQYRCPRYYNRKPRQCTNGKTVAENTVERELIRRIQPAVKDLILQYEIEESKHIDTADQIKKIEKKLERLKDLYINDFIDMTAYKRDREALLADMEKLSKASVERSTEDLRQLLSPDLWELYGTFTNAEKRTFWRGIIKRIEFGKDKQYKIYFL